MKKKFLYSQVLRVFKNALADFSRSAVVTTDGELLFVQTETLSDIATLPLTSHTCMQYLKLGDGDVGLCNDPYSGGGILSNFSLVTGISLGAQNNNADLLISVKLTLKPRITNSLKLDDEGLRIPPTPIMVNGEMNTDILNAMSEHPLYPPELKLALPAAVQNLIQIKESIKKTLKEFKLDFNKNEIKDFLKYSNKSAQEALEELSDGESKVDFELTQNEKLKLKILVNRGRVKFDFSGTDMGRTHYLTFAATFGACVGALFAFTRKEIPINSGTTSLIEVIAPKGSLVNSNFPKPVALGLTDGLDVVANLVISGLGAIDKKKLVATGGASHCAFEIRFADGRRFYDRAHPGTGATSSSAGVHGQSLWWRAKLNTSIEEIERRYPLLISNVNYRMNSGGSGLYGGGNGMTKTYHLLEPAQFVWSMTDAIDKPVGLNGGKAALGPEMILVRGDERTRLPAIGEMKVLAGDQIWVLASGGGGYGAPPTAAT